jgi:hypothetical protein
VIVSKTSSGPKNTTLAVIMSFAGIVLGNGFNGNSKLTKMVAMPINIGH